MREEREENIKTFMKLGLTYQQAKTYLATYDLCTNMGAAPVKLIAKASATARQNVYQTMLSLQKLDLVEKILESPPKFKPLPLKEAAETLLNKKKQQYQKLKAATKRLSEKTEQTYGLDKDCEFVLIPKGEAHRRRIFEALNGAQKSIKSIMSLPEPTLLKQKDTPKPIQEAIERGVKVQVLSNQPKKNHNYRITYPSQTQEDGLYEIRYANAMLPIMCCIIDQKELFVNLEKNRDPIATCVVWTNNFGLTAIVNDYFDRAWQNAEPS